MTFIPNELVMPDNLLMPLNEYIKTDLHTTPT